MASVFVALEADSGRAAVVSAGESGRAIVISSSEIAAARIRAGLEAGEEFVRAYVSTEVHTFEVEPDNWKEVVYLASVDD